MKYPGVFPSFRKYLEKGDKGVQVERLQRFLNWALDKQLETDAIFGNSTEAAVKEFQRKVGIKDDGIFGKDSLAKAKAYDKPSKGKYPGKLPDPTTVVSTDNAGKIVGAASNIAWPYGTAERKWKYKTGSPTSKCASVMKHYGWSSRKSMSDCGYFVSSAVMHSGVESNFDCLKGYDWDYSLTNLYIAKSGTSISTSDVKPGDIIRYRKTGGGQHTLIYVGNGKIAEAGREVRFGVIRASSKYTGKKKKVEILRAKESTTTRSYMKKGDKGSNVGEWQAFLDWYYDGQVGGVDCIFGPNTHNWTVKFQEEKFGKGQGDGLVGQKTIDAAAKCEK